MPEENNITVLPEYTIKVALDTQLLSYLVDNTYPKLTLLIEELGNSPFVNLVCSRFVTYEFIGIRKKEHYLRLALRETTEKGGVLNISSFLNYRNAYSAPEYDYADAFKEIISLIEDELEAINDNYNISYDESVLHDALWKPHKEVYLSSRLSKEDSVVLLSSVFPSESEKEAHLVFLTNDSDFQKAFDGGNSIKTEGGGGEKVNVLIDIFKGYGLRKPYVYHMGNISLLKGPKKIDPIKDESCTERLIKEFLKEFILQHIIEKNKENYLGKTFRIADGFDEKDIVGFKIDDEVELENGIYITAIHKELKTIYNSQKVSEFWYKGSPIANFPFRKDDEGDQKDNITFKFELDDFDKDEMNEIRVNLNSGDYILFVHPSSSI